MSTRTLPARTSGRLAEGMGIQPNPYAAQAAPGSAPYVPYVPYPHYTPVPVRDAKWWTVPAVYTPLVLLFAYLDFTSYGTPLPPVWALGHLVSVALVAASWLPAGTVRRRSTRHVLGALACLYALAYTKVIMTVAVGAFVVALITGNVSS